MTIWYILCSFGTFFSGFDIIYQENLATLDLSEASIGTILSPSYLLLTLSVDIKQTNTAKHKMKFCTYVETFEQEN
jgi:hypothetical protein